MVWHAEQPVALSGLLDDNWQMHLLLPETRTWSDPQARPHSPGAVYPVPAPVPAPVPVITAAAVILCASSATERATMAISTADSLGASAPDPNSNPSECLVALIETLYFCLTLQRTAFAPSRESFLPSGPASDRETLTLYGGRLMGRILLAQF